MHTEATEIAARCRGVTFRWPTGTLALEGVNLDVHAGECLAVIGPNGGGKSTLMKLLTGLLAPQQGDIAVFGMTPERARRQGVVGYVPQRHAVPRRFPISVREAVSMGATARAPWWRGMNADERDAVDEALETVGATPFADRPVGMLSGGQLQRAMIARALASRPRILALDEPTTGIDEVGRRRFAELIEHLRRDRSRTLLIVSHDIRAVVGVETGAGATALCDRIACLRRTLHFHDAPDGVTPQILAEVFEHDLSDIFGNVHVHAHHEDECDVPGHRHEDHA